MINVQRTGWLVWPSPAYAAYKRNPRVFSGRFMVIIPVLCIAGMLAAKKLVPVSAGTMPTHDMLFTGLLIGTIVIVGGLTFFPALALGPVAERFAMIAGARY